jgi:hypothetical protein
MSATVGCNILLTGLPRSGTNLSCALLNQVEQTVALAEPMDVAALGRTSGRSEAMWVIERFLQVQRHSLLSRGTALTRHSGGQVRDNFFASVADADGLRRSHSERGAIDFGKPLDPDFRLIVKHPAVFTGLLPEVAESFPCFALIRNPLSVLASWNSNQIPVREGRAPAAEGVDPQLRSTLDGISSCESRQLYLLDWFFRRFHECLPSAHLIRYEVLISTRGRALSVIAPNAQTLDEALTSRNASPLYGWGSQHDLVQRLLDSEGAYWRFYRREEVVNLFESALSQEAQNVSDPDGCKVGG